ncbi:MAG TPA: BsuPI-related putative proteinase inhibitor [Gemmatimonadota bacterium]|nr:BsuPI-related putative proteinase inhibitor [Gemmatimonadota bacterium]
MSLSNVLRSLAAATLVACTGASTPTSDGSTPGAGSPRGGAVVQDGIEYTGDVAVMESFPVQLRGRVTIANRSGEDRTVIFPDGCVALLRVYRPGDSEPVWDQAGEQMCTMALVPLALAPGASREVSTPTASGHDILGEELPDGEYRVAIYLRPDGGLVEIDAGTVDLAIPR